MQYATLGRTGFKVSRLGFGAMRLPMKGDLVDRDLAIPMIHRAFEAGVNYIDTAVGYCNGDSQRVVGEALKGWRDRIVVSTKNHYYNKADDRPWWKHLEDSLRRLDVETIDIYNFHGLRWERFIDQVDGPDGQLTWMQKAKDQGLIRHICFSFHDTGENLVKLGKTGAFDSVTLQYNLLDRSNEKAIAAVRKMGMGVVVMGPVGGGRLGSPSEAIQKMIPGARSVPEVALRFVLANPGVTIALSGMSTMGHVEENVRVASKTTPLSATEKRRVQSTLRRYKKLAELYCTGCDYCMPCPAGVEIPRNFMALNYARVYGLADVAREQYGRIRGKATRCLACGKCLEKCPQNIDIIAQLRETVRTLDDAYGKLAVRVQPTALERLVRRGSRFDLKLACRLEAHNLSDEEARPELDFAPPKGIEVAASRGLGTLGPFARRAVKLAVSAKGLADGKPLRLGASLDGPMEMVLDHDPLRLALARKACRKSPQATLARVPKVCADEVAGDVTPSAKARAAHALAARFAHDSEALVIELDARGRFGRPVSPRRNIRDADAAWLSIHLRDARGLKLAKGGQKHFALAFGFPKAGEKAMPVAAFRPRLGGDQIKAIQAEVKGRGTRRRALIRIPWTLLGISKAAPGARLGINFGMACWPARGKAAWRLTWSQEGRGHLLIAK